MFTRGETMQKILGYMRKAVTEYDMLSDGDRIAVGVSGGKDSLVLLDGLILLRNFIGIDYELIAVTVDPRFNGVDGDYSQVARFCSEKGVRYVLEPSHIGSIVFDVRKEDHPCSLCARMRRGALHNIARREGCNKLALGHHLDDAVETFLMNLFVVGRIGCFSPVSEPKTDSVGLIRPLALAREWEISAAARRNGLEAVRSRCPADGHTMRQEIKKFIAEREKLDRGFTDRVFGAMRRAGIDGWGTDEE